MGVFSISNNNSFGRTANDFASSIIPMGFKKSGQYFSQCLASSQCFQSVSYLGLYLYNIQAKTWTKPKIFSDINDTVFGPYFSILWGLFHRLLLRKDTILMEFY